MSVASPEYRETPPGGELPYAPIRVLVIGGATLFRAGLRALVEQADGIEIVGEGSTLAEALQHVDGLPPDIALVDTSYATDLGLRTVEELRQGNAPTRVLIVTAFGEPEAIGRMVLGGARGVVFNDVAAEHLLTAIRKVHAGQLWFDRATVAQIITGIVGTPGQDEVRPEYAKIASLTRREREVIVLVASGLSNKAIAARMTISTNTARHLLTSIFRKLGVRDRMTLALYAIDHSLVPPKT